MIFAGFWKRFGAYIVDLFVINIILICIAVFSLLIILRNGADMEIIKQVMPWIVLIVFVMYFSIMEASSKQATLGKMVFGLKVADIDGNRISFLRALGRNTAKLLSILSIIGFLMAAFTKKKQTFHDILLGCLVIKDTESKTWLAVPISLLSFFLVPFIVGAYIYFMYRDVLFRLESPAGLSNVVALPELLGSDVKIPEILSESEYDSFLSSKKTDFESGIKSTSGPAAFQISQFWDSTDNPHVWLKIRLAPVPNITLGSAEKYVRVIIKHVWDQNHSDVYNRESQFENEIFQRLHFPKALESTIYLETIRDVHLKAGVKDGDIESIEGELTLKLPINAESAIFDTAGKVATVAGERITLKDMKGSEIILHYEGLSEYFLGVIAYNEMGRQLGNIGSSSNSTTETKFLFGGTIKSIKVVGSSTFIERRYPFIVRKH